VTFLNLPPTPKEFRNEKINVSIAAHFAIFLGDLVNISSTALEIVASKNNNK